eukprot:664284-Rhodomonas_salina.4
MKGFEDATPLPSRRSTVASTAIQVKGFPDDCSKSPLLGVATARGVAKRGRSDQAVESKRPRCVHEEVSSCTLASPLVSSSRGPSESLPSCGRIGSRCNRCATELGETNWFSADTGSTLASKAGLLCVDVPSTSSPSATTFAANSSSEVKARSSSIVSSLSSDIVAAFRRLPGVPGSKASLPSNPALPGRALALKRRFGLVSPFELPEDELDGSPGDKTPKPGTSDTLLGDWRLRWTLQGI